MDRALPTALVAVLLAALAVSVPVLSAGAGEAPGDPPVRDGAVAGVAPNGTNATVTRLGVGAPLTADGFTVPSPDVGTAVAIGDREFRGQLVGYGILQRLREGDTTTANRTAFRTGLDDFQERVELLRDVERGATAAYYSGEIDADGLLRRIARVHAEAGATTAALGHVRERARAIDDDAVTFSLRARSFSVERDFDGFETPLRELLNRSFRGGEAAPRVHVLTSENGLVLEVLHDGTYVRDAVRFDHYDPTEPPSVDRSEAISMVFERYPTLAGNSSVSGPNQIAGRLWQVRVRYPAGESTVFLDRSTEQVYREVHELALSELHTRAVASREAGGVEVLINRTPAGNPYHVRVVDSRTGDPLDATVAVAGEVVGTTGPGGTLWTLGPQEAFEVSVRTDRQTVNVSLGG
jgi:hypothetical protein